jgi:adenine-specific DNA-methyltransferase
MLSKSLTGRARSLRRNQTDAEQKLWRELRSRQLNNVKFRRQHPIGRYVADFCAPEHKLILELDGGHHALQTEKDEKRSKYFMSLGYTVLRFWDNDVLKHANAVLETIGEALAASYPHPGPLPKRERGKLESSLSKKEREKEKSFAYAPR